MIHCEGKCSREAIHFIKHDEGKWLILDLEGYNVARAYFCPFCGKPLGFDEIKEPLTVYAEALA